MTVNYHFAEGYPDIPLVVELKSVLMSDKLLDGLVKVCEEEAKKWLGEQQVRRRDARPPLSTKLFPVRWVLPQKASREVGKSFFFSFSFVH